MSSLLPPALPELGLDGGRPAATSIGSAAAIVRLGARVVTTAGPDPVIETAQGRALLQGAPPLRTGAALILEFPRADAALPRAGRLVSVDQQRLEPPVPIRLRPAPAPQPAATVRAAGRLEVELRPVGPEGRPLGPPLTARLVAVPESGSLATGSRPSPPAPTAVAAASRGRSAPSARSPAQSTLRIEFANLPTTARAGASSAPSPAIGAPATTGNSAPPAHGAAPEPAHAFAARPPIEVIVLRRDARDRVLLRGAGVTFAVETPVKLPVGARLQVTLPAELARPNPALQSGPLKAVRHLAAALSEEAGAEDPANAAAPRLPQPAATLAARLLRLVQLITQHGGETGPRSTTQAEGAEAPARTARITAALAELGRLAGEPQSGGWRAFLLPLGFEGTPMLRLYLREEPYPDEGKGRRPVRSPASRRAVFELEFGKLGRCQIDVLCQAQRFDLIMRTEQPMDPHLRQEIRELYVAARDAAGLLGELRFRAGEWVGLPELSAPGGPGAGITI